MSNIIHPAVRIVQKTMGLWERAADPTGERAMLIVQRLIETGHIRGEVRVDMAYAPDDKTP